jgi:ribonuclease HI
LSKLTDYDIIAYTDGACRIDVGIGGWGVHLVTNNDVVELCGGEHCIDSNRMELKAACVALQKIPLYSKIAIYSDSSYVVDGVLSWLPTWKRDWDFAYRVPRTNSDLWHVIRHMLNYHKTSWRWVKGHSTSQGNRRADILATRGMEELLGENYGMPDI